MIAFIGTTEDDILYFKTKMVLQKEETVFDSIHVYIGVLAKKDICVVATGYSLEVSACITTAILDKYDPYLVFNIGSVHSFEKQLKQGDIFLAERVYMADIDLTPVGRLNYGEVPELPPFYISENSLLNEIESQSVTISNKYLVRGSLLCSNKFFTKSEEIEPLMKEHFLNSGNLIATDTESGGVALACSLKNVPYVCLKSVSYEMDQESQLINHIRKGLEVQPIIGKIITKLLLSESAERK